MPRLVFFLFFLFSSYSYSQLPPSLPERCEYGFRSVYTFRTCAPSASEGSFGNCYDIYNACHEYDGRICGYGDSAIDYVVTQNCATRETEWPPGNKDGCFPVDGNCEDNQRCRSPSGLDEMTINQSQSCGDICETESGPVSCDQVVNDDYSQGPYSSTGPTDEWNCQYNPFMCAYDTNNDGQITDDDNQDQWPDPNDDLPDGSACVNWGPDACQIVDDYTGENNSGGNGSGGDGSGGDGSGGDGSGGDGSGGDGSGGDGSGGDGDIDGGDPQQGDGDQQIIDCLDVEKKIYCDAENYQAYGFGWASLDCTDGPERIVPNELCPDDAEDPEDPNATETEKLLKELVQEAKDNGVTLGALLQSMDTSQAEIIRQLIDSKTESVNALDSINDGIASLKTAIEGVGSEPTNMGPTIDAINGVKDKIEEVRTQQLPIVEQGYFNIAGANESFESAKTTLQNKVTEIQGDVSDLFAISFSGSGSLGCSSTYSAMGKTGQICLSHYETQLSYISAGLVLMSIIAAGFIILGGIRS